ncbi:acyltransferase [Novosphingobium sp. BL-8A]|uniref:acyltransferase family protein n=1 Tax=Novosphingobium sp. BL-8A TaxID=3127639 RepID=UPI003756E8E3
MRVIGKHARLAPLTSLRFFAALLVLLSHLVFLQSSQSPALRAGFDQLLRQGACGVTFFFILSGFILAYAYEQAIADRDVPLGVYLYRRVVRIFPLHLIVALAVLAYLTWRGDPPPLQAIALNLGLLHSWSPNPFVHYSLNGPSWSLSNELFFYALFPWLVKLDRRLLGWLFIAGMAVIAVGACLAALWTGGYSPFVDWLFYVFPITRLFEFVAGILLCHAWRRGAGRSWAGSGTEVLLTLSIPAIMFAVEWFAVPLVFRYQLVFILPMSALILVFAHGRGALSHLLRSPALQLLGEASFALYLIHRPMIIFMARWAGHGAASDVALAGAMLVLTIPASIAVYLLLDRPLEQWFRRNERTLFRRTLSGLKA